MNPWLDAPVRFRTRKEQVLASAFPRGGYSSHVRTQSPDTSPEAEKVLIELLRKAPPWRRLQLADRLSWSMREMSLAGIRQRNPNATDAEVRRLFADIHLGPELARKVFGEMLVSNEC